jgi:hypothetical protein
LGGIAPLPLMALAVSASTPVAIRVPRLPCRRAWAHWLPQPRGKRRRPGRTKRVRPRRQWLAPRRRLVPPSCWQRQSSDHIGRRRGSSGVAPAAGADAAAAGSGWLGELAAGGCRHVDHGLADFDVFKVAAALCAHRALALQGRVPEGVKARLDAWSPGAGITELGRASRTGAMAGDALCLVDFFARLEGAVRITDFNHADFLDPLSHRFCAFVRAGCRLVGRSNVINQPMMAKTGTTKEKKTAASSCWGVLIGPVWASSWAVVWSFALMASSKTLNRGLSRG